MKRIDWTRLLTWLIVPLLAAVFYGSIIYAVFRSCCDRNNPLPAVRSDTIIVRDTIHDSVPKLVYQEVVRYVKETPVKQSPTPTVGCATAVPQPPSESVYLTDSGEVIVPISRKVYTDDSTYRAVVSGYKATLDRIDVYRQQMVITNTVTKSRRWNIGLTGGLGYGLVTGKPDLFLGVGVTYNLLPP